MATHSSALAWEIPWTEVPSGLQSMELEKRHNLATKQQKLLSRDGTIWHDNVFIKFKTTHFRIFCPPRMPFAFFLPIKPNLKVKLNHCLCLKAFILYSHSSQK